LEEKFWMSDVTIRDAMDSDAAALRDLIFPILREYGLQPDPDGTDADLEAVESGYRARGGHFWVVERGGVVVGSCALYPLGGGAVELRKMYLHPSLRGAGWGRGLLELALDTARRDGYTRMQLETATALVEAISLYRSYGFERQPGDPAVPRCDQSWSLQLR
jgi:GNAT superfamily N-acetyltransferase